MIDEDCDLSFDMLPAGTQLPLVEGPAEEVMGGDRGRFVREIPGTPSTPRTTRRPAVRGYLVFREGQAMASSDYATVTLTGVGGHGARARSAADPIGAGASIVMAPQTIVSRNAEPQQLAIVTVDAIQRARPTA